MFPRILFSTFRTFGARAPQVLSRAHPISSRKMEPLNSFTSGLTGVSSFSKPPSQDPSSTWVTSIVSRPASSNAIMSVLTGISRFSTAASQSCEGDQKVFSNSCKQNSKPEPKLKSIPRPLSISTMATKQIIEFVKSAGKDPSKVGLKIGVTSSGCSGNSYTMEFGDIDTAKMDGDEIFEQDGAIVIVKKNSFLMVFGSHLDFEKEQLSSGFKLSNPQVAKACGCGSSFKIKRDPNTAPRRNKRQSARKNQAH